MDARASVSSTHARRSSWLLIFGIYLVLGWCTPAFTTPLTQRPPLGWSSWNAFHEMIDEATLLKQAKAIKSSGLLDAGYTHFNIDEGWELRMNVVDADGNTALGDPVRNASGFLVPDPTRFPRGLEPMITEIKSLGFKFGMYAPMTAPDPDGKNSTIGWEKKDAAYFVSIGAEWVKVDALKMPRDPVWTKQEVQRWRDAINAAGASEHFFFSNCHCGCMSAGDARRGGWQKWCPQLTDMWRTSNDIQPDWSNVLHNVDTLVGIGHQAGPGFGWNDPDILEIGVNAPIWDRSKPGLSLTEGKTNFALWCITSAPLLLGFDATTVSHEVLSIVGSKSAIAVNQAWAGKAGDRAWVGHGVEAWAKPLPGNSLAVVVYNRGNSTFSGVAIELEAIGFTRDRATVTDVWTNKIVTATTHALNIPPLSSTDSVFWTLK